MVEPITVNLPAEIRTALDDASRRDGVSRDEFVSQAVKERLFAQRFRLLRDRMVPKAQAQGVITDEDVFGRVS
jgi:metal-responsive CopG/Arc/MetJ family transcriptional regulator